VLRPRQQQKLARGAKDEEHAMSAKLNIAIAVVGIDIGKNSFHVVGLDLHGAIVLRQKWSRGQVETRLANLPPCLIGMEACVGAHHLSRKLRSLGHEARLMPAKYVRPYSRGQKNDFRDAEAIAEAVQRPTMKFVATKSAEQLDLQALHRVRERLISRRTGIINQIRAFLLERGVAVRQGLRFLRAELPRILATPRDVLSPRMVRVLEDLAGDWRRLDERIEGLSSEIEVLAQRDVSCERLMSVPGGSGSNLGSSQPRSGCITMSSPLRSPTNSLALPGASWPTVEHSRRARFSPRDQPDALEREASSRFPDASPYPCASIHQLGAQGLDDQSGASDAIAAANGHEWAAFAAMHGPDLL